MAFPLSGKEKKRCSMIPYIELMVSLNKNKWKEKQVLEKIVLFIQSVGGTQYLELGTAVNRITYFLLLRSKRLNEFLCQHIPLFQERSCLQHRLIHNFRFALSVSFCRKAIFGNTSFNQIANNRFRTSLRKTLIVSVISFIVTMSSKLDGYIRVINKAISSSSAVVDAGVRSARSNS